MPLIEVIKIKNGSKAAIYVWNITETLNFIEKETFLTPDEAEKYRAFKNESRKKQWLTTRLLLQKILKNDYAPILYDLNGQPLLKDGYISISHSKDWVAVYISEIRCGVDLEIYSDKIERISSKYLSDAELILIKEKAGNQSHYTDFLHLAWCAKESVFKWFSDGGLNFKIDMEIKNIDTEKIVLEFRKTNQLLELNCQLKKNDGYYLVYLAE